MGEVLYHNNVGLQGLSPRCFLKGLTSVAFNTDFMDALQNIFESQIQEALSFKKIVTQVIAKKLKARGIKLNEKQSAKIESQLEHVDGDKLTLSLDEEGLQSSKSTSLVEFKNLQISLGEEDVDRVVSRFIKKIPLTMPAIVQESSEILLKRLKQSGRSVMNLDDALFHLI